MSLQHDYMQRKIKQNTTLDFIINPEGDIEKSALGRGFIFSGRLPWGWNPHRSYKSDCWRELFTLLDFQPVYQILVTTISAIAICQNRSISFSAASGGAETLSG